MFDSLPKQQLYFRLEFFLTWSTTYSIPRQNVHWISCYNHFCQLQRFKSSLLKFCTCLNHLKVCWSYISILLNSLKQHKPYLTMICFSWEILMHLRILIITTSRRPYSKLRLNIPSTIWSELIFKSGWYSAICCWVCFRIAIWEEGLVFWSELVVRWSQYKVCVNYPWVAIFSLWMQTLKNCEILCSAFYSALY